MMIHGTGGLESGYDPRDYHYQPSDRGGFDWDTGFDIEQKLGFKIKVKDQDGSGSCGGQAWSYYGEVLEAIVTGTYEPRSASWIYSHTRIVPSGSRGRENCDFVVNNGWVKEIDAPSYNNGNPPKEKFFDAIPVLSKEAIEDSEVSRALSYLNVKSNIEVFAQAIQDHNGMIMVVNGEDNGTWRSKFPKPPVEKEWGHFLYACKVKLINSKKYIGVINSWGKDVGDNGIQWIGEEYFNSGHVREGWTLAWNYEPAKHKLILAAIIKNLTKILELLNANTK